MNPRRRLLLVAAGLLALFAAAAYWRRRPPSTDEDARAWLARRSPEPSGLNLVLVTIDTLRADRLGCYGFREIETPRIDGLARDGVLFERATTTVPLTFPAHSSIFTGRIPPHHGVRDNGGFFLDDKETTLAERLKTAGYTTGAFVGAWVLESKWGLAQGFDTYSDQFELSKYKVLSLGTVQKKGDEVMDDALAWLRGQAGKKLFAWIHLYDPHAPYEPPEPYLSRYPGKPYLGEIAYADHVVGRLLDWLSESGLLRRTLVVLLADHGESLGEHGEAAHGFFIYDATVHVPLVIRTPWGLTGRVPTPVSTVDLFPTLLDLLGLAPQPGIDGRSLVRAVLDPGTELRHVAYSETYFPRYHFGWQQLRGLRSESLKFIDAPTPELYDLRKDAAETTNVYKAYSKRAEQLRQQLETLVGEPDSTAPERQKLDPDTLQRLAALGYVGNAGGIDPKAALPDPKDKIGLFERMGAAKDAAQADRLDEAIAGMRAVLAEDDKIIDAHLTLGNWLAKARRSDEAIEAFKQALALKPDDEIALSDLARQYRQRGGPDDLSRAIEGYKSALKLDAKSPQNWYQLATLYLDLGRVAEAEQTLREALAANPRMGAAYNTLGVIAFSRGRLPEAENLVRRGLELESKVRTGRYNLARVLEERGRLDDALSLYREELETFPDNGKARFNLAQLLRHRGDLDGYIRELKAGVDQAPDFGPCYFFLAREQLTSGDLDAAADLATRGLAADPSSEIAPLGHYVLADVFNRRGDRAKADAEVASARRLEAEIKQRPQSRI